MASPTRTLTVNFVGRTSNLDKSFKRVAKGSQLMSDRLMKATRMAGIGFTALGAVAVGAAMALKPMIDQAAEVEESLSKNRVVFGENAKAVEQFADRSLQAFGVTRREALEATGVIGALGSAMGMAEADSADMATALVGLAGDMSSFNNASVEETLTAIQAGLRGENEPLRRFGVLLDAITLKNKALEKGIIKSTKEALTPQAKALAAYAVILEQTEIQMGDFERTSDSATNQQKLLAGTFDDLKTQIGEKLLPMFTAIVSSLNDDVMPAIRDFVDDPSIENLAKIGGRTWGTAFGEEASVEISNRVGDGLRDMVQPGSTALPPSVVLWKRILGGFNQGLEEVRIEQTLNAMFDRVTAGFGIDLEAMLNNEFGRDNPDFDRGDDWTMGGSAPANQAGIVLPALTGLLEPALDVALPDAVTKVVPDVIDDVVGEGRVPGGFEIDPELQRFLDVVGTSAWDRFMAPAGSNTSIVVNAPAVSGQEVVEAIGKYVDDNGPLPPHWQQTAE